MATKGETIAVKLQQLSRPLAVCVSIGLMLALLIPLASRAAEEPNNIKLVGVKEGESLSGKAVIQAIVPGNDIARVEFELRRQSTDPMDPTPSATPSITPTETMTATTVPTTTMTPTATTVPTGTMVPTGTLMVRGLTLINADTDRAILPNPLANGATIDLAKLPTRNLSIRANTTPMRVGSVQFGLNDNPSLKVENTPPYAIAGDNPYGNYLPWTPPVGTHTLTVTPYSGRMASGAMGTPLVVTFTIVDTGAGITPTVTVTPTMTMTPTTTITPR